MAVGKVLARDWTIEINTGTTAIPVWTEILGLESHTFSGDLARANTTSREDEGVRSHLPASRGRDLTMEGFYMVDPDTGARDPGQAAVEASSKLVGPSGLDGYRLTDPSNTVLCTFNASAEVTSQGGGGTDDAADWKAALGVSGVITWT